MTIFIEIIDKTNRRIRLTKERWKHILKHPEMPNKLEEIRQGLEKPVKITSINSDPQVKYYYIYCKNELCAKFLRVTVKYLNGTGFIITAYLVETIR